ncbi:MAG TPA: MBL fold metallo-hydrolase [Thermoanaerobaculia bacterium]|nr:MBL fold metallo-hydrolase [Thermoanaerobaculia bacterium]
MARPHLRLPANVPGDFFVDSTCIDCATCRQMAPEVFAPGDGFSYVASQPGDPAAEARALKALVACPTGSIGAANRAAMTREAANSFPEPYGDGVCFCGYTSEKSFGAWSWLAARPEGNVLVDSPRAAGPLLSGLERLGGVATLFLTHRDDVADHAALRKRFGCDRVIHARDAAALGEPPERALEGDEPVRLADDLVAIPTPGHTRGHAVLLWKDTVLFTGDHLAFSKRRGHLVGFRDACWYSWKEQIRSMERLLDFSFTRVLPGHGETFRAASPAAMRKELERCVAWMKTR